MMAKDNDNFDLVSIGDLKRRSEFRPENRSPLSLDPHNVPSLLHYLIPLAEKWGNPDDTVRDILIESSSSDELIVLKAQVRAANTLPTIGWQEQKHFRRIQPSSTSCFRQ